MTKIAILSDIHDNVWNLKKALGTRALQQTAALLCCGDLCAPFIIKLLGQGYQQDIHLVLGNNDGDVAAFIRVAAGFPQVQLHGEYFRGTLGGKTFAMNHYPDKARSLAESGTYDVVCYGHDHQLNRGEQTGSTLLVNPGTIMGYHGGTLQDIEATFMVIDTLSLQVDVHRL